MKTLKKLSPKALKDKMRQYACVHCEGSDNSFCELRTKGLSGPDAFREVYLPEMKKKYGDTDPYYDQVEDAFRNAKNNNQGSEIDQAMFKAVQNARKRVGGHGPRKIYAYTSSSQEEIDFLDKAIGQSGQSVNKFMYNAMIAYLEIINEDIKQKEKEQNERDKRDFEGINSLSY